MGLSGMNLTLTAVQRSGCWGKQKSGYSLEAVRVSQAPWGVTTGSCVRKSGAAKFLC